MTENEILGSKAAATFLDISPNQLYKLSAGGKIPTYSPTGGKIYFLKSELTEWVLSKRRAAVRDINSRVNNYINNKK
jgi:hypothetical protein